MGRALTRWGLLASFVLAVACDGGSNRLVVDLRTDLIPGIEFSSADVMVDSAVPISASMEPSADYVRGARLAELDGVSSGTHEVRVVLRLAGDLVLERPVLVQARDRRTLSGGA